MREGAWLVIRDPKYLLLTTNLMIILIHVVFTLLNRILVRRLVGIGLNDAGLLDLGYFNLSALRLADDLFILD